MLQRGKLLKNGLIINHSFPLHFHRLNGKSVWNDFVNKDIG